MNRVSVAACGILILASVCTAADERESEASATRASLPPISELELEGGREIAPNELAPLLSAVQSAISDRYGQLEGRRLSDEIAGRGWAIYEYRGKSGAIDLGVYRAASAAAAAKQLRQIDLQVPDRSRFAVVPDLGDEACRYGPEGMLLVRRSNLLIKITTAKGPDHRDVAKLVLKCIEDVARKVTTGKQADKVARGSLSLIPALYHTKTEGPFRLSREVSGFAEQGESIWEVKFYMGATGKELFQSVWVSSSGNTRTMLPDRIRNLPAIAKVAPKKKVVDRDDPILLSVTITNAFSEPIVLTEDFDFRLVRAERDGRPVRQNSTRHTDPTQKHRKPEPIQLSGGESMTFQPDARRWKLYDGWRPGKYQISLGVEGVRLDPNVTAFIRMEPVMLEIRK